jgi:hypothetical protein
MPVIPALGRPRQEDHEFKANLGKVACSRPDLAREREI